MAKGEEEWDDSLLIKAFDRAISTFKVMHGKDGQNSSSAGGEVIGSQEQCTAGLVSESNMVKRDLETNGNTVASTTETKETTNPSEDIGSLVGEKNGQNLHNGYSKTESTEDYNHLLSQYYEVEEQRQKILNQLYQYGTWDYGGYDSNMQSGNNLASQDYQVPAQASCPTDSIVQVDGTSASQGHHQVLEPQARSSAVAHSCCSCMCPCTSLRGCNARGTCVGDSDQNTSAAGHNGNPSFVKTDDMVNTALRAADGALSALQTKASGDANTSKDEEIKLETDIGKLAQSCSSKTDLTDVFNAWQRILNLEAQVTEIKDSISKILEVQVQQQKENKEVKDLLHQLLV